MERVGPWLQTNWDRRAAGNFIAGGSGSGLAIVAAANAFWSGEVGRSAFALSALLIALGLLFVWFEIGRPSRFLHVFFHPQTSWMTREATLAPPLLLVLAATAWSQEAALAALSAGLAFAFLYCQARILSAAKGIPAWRAPALVPLFVATGFAEGAGLLLVLMALSGGIDGLFLPVLALAAIAARQIAWTIYRQSLGPEAPEGTRAALKAITLPVLLLATLAPFILIGGALAFVRLAASLALAAGALALAGGWFLKSVVITRAAFTQGFALPHLSALAASARERRTRPRWS